MPLLYFVMVHPVLSSLYISETKILYLAFIIVKYSYKFKRNVKTSVCTLT